MVKLLLVSAILLASCAHHAPTFNDDSPQWRACKTICDAKDRDPDFVAENDAKVDCYCKLADPVRA